MKFDRLSSTIILVQTLELIIPFFITLARFSFTKYNNEFGRTLSSFMVSEDIEFVLKCGHNVYV